MSLTRRRRSVAAGLCIAIVLAAAFLPGLSAFDCVVVELPWVLLPDETTVSAAEALPEPAVQSPSLRSLLPSRAPPATSAA